MESEERWHNTYPQSYRYCPWCVLFDVLLQW